MHIAIFAEIAVYRLSSRSQKALVMRFLVLSVSRSLMLSCSRSRGCKADLSPSNTTSESPSLGALVAYLTSSAGSALILCWLNEEVLMQNPDQAYLPS